MRGVTDERSNSTIERDARKSGARPSLRKLGAMLDPQGLAAIFLGWRYLLQPSFRRRVHEEWKADTSWNVAVEVFWGAVGVLFSTALIISLFIYLLE